MLFKKITRKRIHGIIGTLFYVFFFAVFISDNQHLGNLAKRIDAEIIRPYTLRVADPTLEQTHTSNTEVIADPSQSPREFIQPTNPPVTIVYVTPTPQSIQISEQELWNTLMTYRATHGKSSVEMSESLCSYARERAVELSNRLATNPDDPLDGHAGFSRDAESGYVFEKTGFNAVGENLAYTPSYTNATQIIEWGWDSSPGHRSLQLSDDISHGCIAGTHPIYVGIYTY